MASGYGNNGGPGRCFPFWQEVLACYIVNSGTEDMSGQGKCAPILEDYYECLHHKKELQRVRVMQEAYRRKLLENPSTDAPSVGEMRSLGLIKDQKPEDVNLRPMPYLPHKGPSSNG